MPETEPPPYVAEWLNAANDRPLIAYQGYFGHELGKEPGLILDVAAGVGAAAAEINNSPDHQATVIAVDLAYPYIRPVTDTAVAADALHLPFADNTFDLVVCSWLLAHLKPSEAARALGEMLRVAQPGADVMVNPSNYLRRMSNEEFARKQLIDAPTLASWIPYLIPTLIIPKPEDYPDWSQEERQLACRSLARHVTLRSEISILTRLRQALAGLLPQKQ